MVCLQGTEEEMWRRIQKVLPHLAPNNSATADDSHSSTHVGEEAEAAAAANPGNTAAATNDHVHSYRADVGTLVLFHGLKTAFVKFFYCFFRNVFTYNFVYIF